MNEQELLNTIIKEQDWEELIYNIVTIENLDPWDIDLVKLTKSFLAYLKKIEELDFRIPAKVVLVAAILLKLKIEYIGLFREEVPEIISEEVEELSGIDFEALDEYLNKFHIPVKRKGTRKITLDELVDALKKALAVEERRIKRKGIITKRIREEIEVSEEDIETKIAKILNEIETLLKKLKKDKIRFSQIVEEWSRECIVDHFIPILHLNTRGEIDCEQKEMFKEIYISKQNSNH
jgi:segregation and condensation protein A